VADLAIAALFRFYGTSGHMSVQIQPERVRASWPQGATPTDEQLRDAADGYAAYFGTYTVDEKAKTVTHHREGSLNLNDPTLVRRYEFRSDGTLALWALERPSNVLIWAPLK
jgi:Lipocalin-like domain